VTDASPPLLILASASPRRADLLRDAGIAFEVRAADVDETVRAGEEADDYVRRVAEAKARAVAAGAGTRPVVAADTAVVIDGWILGKPQDADDARRMLALLSGRSHKVLTSVCLGYSSTGRSDAKYAFLTEVCVTTVEFAVLSARDLDWYVATGEPIDKAGAYAIQGLASRFVTRIEGSYSNVVGLPVAVVWRMCNAAGILVS
jgi:septum formation protein